MSLLSLRPKEVQDNLTSLMKEKGITCINIPIVEAEGILNLKELGEVLKDDYDYFLFTSQIGALELKKIDSCMLNLLKDKVKKGKAISIGPETLRALKSLGIDAELITKRYNTKALGIKLASLGVKGKKILLFRSKEAKDTLERFLEGKGAKTKTLRTHRLIASKKVSEACELALRDEIKGLIFTSPFIVRVFAENFRLKNSSLTELSRKGKKIFSIGPATSKALRSYGLKEIYEAKESSSKGLLKLLHFYKF
ncbi:MAG: uroporphyrinogen-III synthase [Nitrososphaerales archaeon]